MHILKNTLRIQNPNNSKVFWKQETKGSKLDSQEKFEDTKGVIRSRKSKKDRQEKGQTTIYKSLHGKPNIEQYESQ
jgi:hypothetical protein